MSPEDLKAELAAARHALTDGDRDRLRGLGIPEPVLRLGLVGLARIDLDRGGRRYQPAEDGAEAFLTPARIGADPSSPEDPRFELVAHYGELIDLVAWRPDYPDHWATRCGLAAWLGAIEPQLMEPPPVPVRRSVLSWLRAGASGLCLLPDDELDAYRVLAYCRAIEAEDRAHAEALSRICERPFHGPVITVPA